jgi:hypothetical protein
VTSLPDWLVERAALDEVPPASRDRIDRADPRELADRVAAVRDDSAAELARHPAGPAIAQIDARVIAEIRRRERRRRRQLGWLGIATGAATVLLVVRFAADRTVTEELPADDVAAAQDEVAQDEPTRAKGTPRLVVFRQVGDQAERLAQDAFVRPGDVVQLRYSPGGQRHGVIASIDGAGVVTLHFPLSDDAPPEATAMSPKKTALPNAYALDDAPRFERFFFITANDPIDVQQVLAAVRDVALREDSATAALELPAELRQWSLRLRKTDRPSTHHESP